ncbi:MAG TPA: acetyl-CoA carboxylase carboxyltransferase subunit alpha [Thermomicrobiales bacterium]|nr:acetyl-CoA carboxylase carboxyltransferase subunit alpha [Thermomicrobiales bacterium]
MTDSDQATLDQADASTATTEEPAAPTATLSPMDRVRLARDPQRPHTLDYIRELFSSFIELHGDRSFGDDRALLGGLATFRGRTVMVMGHQPGTNTRENIERNFGMPRPEGYRKAVRLMKHAQKFGFPIVTFIDTPAADPGVGSEERGQGTAIAESLLAMIGTEVPIVCVVIGQGGSGGALAISVGDRILMLENAIYAVAPPEACAAILWKDASKAEEAAATMRITAHDIAGFGIIDEVIPEPVPAHEAPRDTIRAVGDRIEATLAELEASVGDADAEAIAALLANRHEKFRRIGAWTEIQA